MVDRRLYESARFRIDWVVGDQFVHVEDLYYGDPFGIRAVDLAEFIQLLERAHAEILTAPSKTP